VIRIRCEKSASVGFSRLHSAFLAGGSVSPFFVLSGYIRSPSYHWSNFNGSGFQPRHLISRLKTAPTFFYLPFLYIQKKEISRGSKERVMPEVRKDSWVMCSNPPRSEE